MIAIEQEERLEKILSSWERRAQVRQNTLLPESLFDHNKKDFLPEWLPFSEHPVYKKQSHLEDKTLSAAWLIYNQVTLDIENDVVIPLCISLQQQLANIEPYNTLIQQTMIDESYHVLLTAHASSVVRKRRNLENLCLPKSGFVLAMEACQKTYDSLWQKHLIHLATGIVTEVFIGSYLSLIANCKNELLQPFNVTVTKAHMLDESVHGFIFAALAEKLIPSLPLQQQEFFEEILPKAVLWYFEAKNTALYSILPKIGFEEKDCCVLLQDCQKDSIIIEQDEHWSKIESLAENIAHKNFTERFYNNLRKEKHIATESNYNGTFPLPLFN